MIGWIFCALVEGHDNVGAQTDLRLHRAFGSKKVRRTIEVRAKRHALLSDFAKLVQAENLKAAGIGENRPRPCHKAMQATEITYGFDSGTQVEVVSITEQNL